MPAPAPKALALDFGKVLTTSPDYTTYAALQKRLGVSAQAFGEAWARHRHEYDRGRHDALAFWSLVLDETVPGIDAQTVQTLVPELTDADFACWDQPRWDFHRVVQAALDDGVPAAIVSNMPPRLGPRFVAKWSWLQRIPYRFFSAEIGLVKPDEAFYRHVLERTGWDPGLVLFVDDLPANVEAAARLGFQTLLFTGSDEDLDTVARWARS